MPLSSGRIGKYGKGLIGGGGSGGGRARYGEETLEDLLKKVNLNEQFVTQPGDVPYTYSGDPEQYIKDQQLFLPQQRKQFLGFIGPKDTSSISNQLNKKFKLSDILEQRESDRRIKEQRGIYTAQTDEKLRGEREGIPLAKMAEWIRRYGTEKLPAEAESMMGRGAVASIGETTSKANLGKEKATTGINIEQATRAKQMRAAGGEASAAATKAEVLAEMLNTPEGKALLQAFTTGELLRPGAAVSLANRVSVSPGEIARQLPINPYLDPHFKTWDAYGAQIGSKSVMRKLPDGSVIPSGEMERTYTPGKINRTYGYTAEDIPEDQPLPATPGAAPMIVPPEDNTLPATPGPAGMIEDNAPIDMKYLEELMRRVLLQDQRRSLTR